MVTNVKQASFTGYYSVKEASMYIMATMERTPIFPKLSSKHLHHWIGEGLGADHLSAEKRGLFVNFLELISFRLISTMRAHGIPSKEVRIASKQLRDRFGWEYPFAMEPIWVAKPDIYAFLEGTHVAVSRYWQAAFDFMSDYMLPIHGLTFDEKDQAINWSPAEGVVLDPKIQFGEPCLSGTRIPTETLWALHSAGDSVEAIAKMYYLSPEVIQSAITWEERIIRSAA